MDLSIAKESFQSGLECCIRQNGVKLPHACFFHKRFFRNVARKPEVRRKMPRTFPEEFGGIAFGFRG